METYAEFSKEKLDSIISDQYINNIEWYVQSSAQYLTMGKDATIPCFVRTIVKKILAAI